MKQLAPISPPTREPNPRPFPDLGDLDHPTLGGPDLLPGVSIVMACRNDATTVAAAIRNAAAAAELISYKHEIIVVDDGSTDLTADRAAVFVTGDGRVQLLLHPHPRGHGEALRAGISAARQPWVVLTDAAFELDLCQLEDFLSSAADHDLLLGWRVMRRGPAGARLNAGMWNWLVSWRLRAPVRDVDCPLKLVRRDLLGRITLASRGAAFDAELYAQSRAQHARVTEIAVRQRPDVADGAASGPSPRPGAGAIAALAALPRANRRRRNPVARPSDQRGAPSRRWGIPASLGVAAISVFAGLGWLYLLFKAGLLGPGPHLGGALPLQQLAGSADQPLLRLAAAWLPAGAVTGIALARLTSWRHPGLAAGAVVAVLLTLTGAASDAVANGQAVAAHLAPQLGHTGLIASALLMVAGAAAASRLTRGNRR